MPKKFKKSKWTILFLAIFTCLIFIFLSSKGVFNPLRSIFGTVAYPFERVFYSVGKKTRGSFDFWRSISNLRKENEKLIRENNSLSAALADLADQKKENEDLRRQLELSPRDKYQLEAALVIGQDPKGFGSWILVDKGESQGLKVGMPAIVFDGILIGKISEVFAHSAKISLLTDSSNSINVSDLQTGARGILKGEYSLGLVLDMVEQSDIINNGDDIITSGLGGFMPKGLLVGKVEKIENTADKLFQKAIVIPRIKYSEAIMVFLVKGEN